MTECKNKRFSLFYMRKDDDNKRFEANVSVKSPNNSVILSLKIFFLYKIGQDSGRTSFFIIATTTQPQKLSWTILTRKAFTKMYISLPDLATRQALINKHLKGRSQKLTSSEIKDLATRMEG